MKNQSFLRTTFISVLVIAACAAASGQKPANIPLYEIPFEYELDKVIVPVTVNEKKTVRLILDTGMPEGIFLMKPKAADGMELDYVAANVMLRGAGSGISSAKMAMGAELKLAEIAFPKQRVIVLIEEGPLSRTDWDGAIGASVFNRFVVEIDIEKEVLRLYAPDKFDAKESGEAIGLTLTRTKPYINASVNIEGKKDVPISAIVDTGSNAGLVISTAKGWVAPANSIDAVLGGGVGGEVEGAIARASGLSLGGHKLKNIVVNFNRGEMPGNAEALIGMGVLNRFHMTFDYTAKKMYLKPSGRFEDAFEFNMIGFSASPAEGGKLTVLDVFSGSPAEAAGIQKGDVITAVDGKDVTFATWSSLQASIRVPGKKITIAWLREGKEFSAEIVTKRLI